MAVSPAIHAYWKKYGNAFRPEETEPLTDDDRLRDYKEFLDPLKWVVDRDQ